MVLKRRVFANDSFFAKLLNMKYKIQCLTYVFSFCLLMTSAGLQAAEYRHSYDDIVEQLSSGGRSRTQVQGDPLDQIQIHGGVAFASSYVSITPPHEKAVSGMLKGFEASFGIDLFSRHWMAEGAVRSYGSEKLSRQQEADLKEFDLKLVYKDRLSPMLLLRVGAGLAARYLNYRSWAEGRGPVEINQVTPASIFLVGFGVPINRTLSLGADLSYRSRLIDDTIDRSSLDIALGINANF